MPSTGMQKQQLVWRQSPGDACARPALLPSVATPHCNCSSAGFQVCPADGAMDCESCFQQCPGAARQKAGRARTRTSALSGARGVAAKACVPWP